VSRIKLNFKESRGLCHVATIQLLCLRGIGLAVAFFFPLNVLFAADESITVTTYYPSPNGVYKTLRLYPGARPGSCQDGQMVYHDGSGGVTEGYYVCIANAWQQMGGGGDPYWDSNAFDSTSINNKNTGSVVIGYPLMGSGEGKLIVEPIDGYISPGSYYEKRQISWGSPADVFGIIGDTNILPAAGKMLSFGSNNQPNQVILDNTTIRMGVGTTSPQASLHVNGTLQLGDSGVASAGLKFTTSSSTTGAWPYALMHTILVGSPAVEKTLYYGNWTSQGDIGIYYARPGTSRIVQTGPTPYYQLGYVDFPGPMPYPTFNITAAGAVGIGSGAPANPALFKLQVAGNVGPSSTAQYSLGNGSNNRYWRTVYSQNIWSLSDRREKSNIIDTPLGIAFIMSLKPVQYTWKKNNDGKHQGLIAQELEQVLRDQGLEFAGLKHDLQSDSYSLAYTELIAPLIKAVQENQKLIEQLESKIEELQ
jgi:hypothetical protein